MPPCLFNSIILGKKPFESYSKILDNESVGITKKKLEIYQNFETILENKDSKYSTKLSFKSTSTFVPDNYVTQKNIYHR